MFNFNVKWSVTLLKAKTDTLVENVTDAYSLKQSYRKKRDKLKMEVIVMFKAMDDFQQ